MSKWPPPKYREDTIYVGLKCAARLVERGTGEEYLCDAPTGRFAHPDVAAHDGPPHHDY